MTIIPFTLGTGLGENVGSVPWFDKAHADDAAFDLRSAEQCFLFPGERYTVDTGLRVAIPEGFAGLVLPRSGLAAKHGITVLNSPGLIDPGYRGVVGVTLWNTGSTLPGNRTEEPFTVEKGDRIAQLLIVRTADVSFHYCSAKSMSATVPDSVRGEGGFGSTGR
jgi:dUTP pyrophosphatase